VPLLLDVAQSLGQTAVPAGCAAYVGTSRKWLCGPRGVGFLAVGAELLERLTPPPTLAAAVHGGVRRYETAEAHVAGRVGLATAVREWTPEVLPTVQARAAQARRLLSQVPGWEVVEPLDAPTGITTLRGGDPFATRAALLRRGFLTSAIPASRAAEMAMPVLRVSTAAWVGEADVAAVAEALTVSG
jgi:pyridoxal 5-phosphate dependent beta-lyase